MITNMVIYGNVEYARQYLDSSQESQNFLRGINSSGDTALTLAACERYPDMVDLIIEKGADANIANAKGRTPLMEAAYRDDWRTWRFIFDVALIRIYEILRV